MHRRWSSARRTVRWTAPQRPLAGPELIWLLGQSNARGPATGPTGGFTARASIPFWYTSEQHTAVALATGGLGIDPYNTTQGRGLELALGAALQDAGRRVGIVKTCRGGVGLWNVIAPWSPNAAGVTNTLQGDWTSQLRSAMAAIVAANPAAEPYVSAIVISQWESDATDVLGTGYGRRMRRWVQRLRAETHPDVWVYWLAPASWQTQTPVEAEDRDILDAEVRAYALTDPRFVIIETEDRENSGDDLHFTSDALQLVGAEIAADYLTRARVNYLDAGLLRGTLYTNEAAALAAAGSAPVYRHPLDPFWLVRGAGKTFVPSAHWLDESAFDLALRFGVNDTLDVATVGDAVAVLYGAIDDEFKSGTWHLSGVFAHDPKTGSTTFPISAGSTDRISNSPAGGVGRMVLVANGNASDLISFTAGIGDSFTHVVDFDGGEYALRINGVEVGSVALADDWSHLLSTHRFTIGCGDFGATPGVHAATFTRPRTGLP